MELGQRVSACVLLVLCVSWSANGGNFLFYALQDIVLENIYWKVLDKYYSEIKGTPTSACEMMSRADIWLMRTYWDFDFPRPFLPNFKFVGGIHCRPAKSLPEDMEAFVQSSGDDGIVVFTLGSLINNITTEKANLIASALAKIPQKARGHSSVVKSMIPFYDYGVLWRYRGEKPESLGANTKIYDWIPQNDLLGTPTSACEMMSRADIWLMRTYWDFDFPRPLLPNFKFVGGIHCRPAKPLPEDLEEFVQSSGDDGIVVFTLGSIIKNITTEKANMIASALAQIPQKVLWRYSGEPPETLGANTRIFDWLPQNDLLGHPKTKAFITHGGTNGIYEAIYHGVPMVGIPMFGDQPENMVHMKSKGVAVTLEFNSINTEDLKDALNAVINEKSYKENALRLSNIHHDRLLSPLDEAVFWIEFTMRNKGAKHLRVQAHELTWYQYHSLDVLAFLLAVVLLLILLLVKICRFCFRWSCCKTGKRKRKAE